jgi:hypothetical protein
MVNRVSWKQLRSVKEPGRYMLRFGWLTITPEDLAIWERHPEATFTLYEVAGDPGNDEYRLESVELNISASGAAT